MTRKKIKAKQPTLKTPLSKKNTIDQKELFEKIQKKAYELFEKRGRTHGNDLADWFEAERLVKAGKC